jgi:rare lipoprotein A
MAAKYKKNLKLVSLSVLLTALNISINSAIAEAKSNKKAKVRPISVLSTSKNQPARNLLNNNSITEKQITPLREQKIIANSFSGRASWYGPGFHGRRTANGEVFNQNALTAAHPSLSFGTKVKVTNLNNGRSVVVRINDRGPYAGGRVIDLSAAAARSLQMIRSGVARVQVTVLGR